MKYLPHLLSFLAFFLVIVSIYERKEENNDAPVPMIDQPYENSDEQREIPSLILSYDLPENISFAEEAVPLNIEDVKERFDKELHINTYWHNNTIFIIKRAHRWLPQISAILKANHIPDDFKYLAVIESTLLNDVSPRGAVGFWQITKNSGKELGLEINKAVDERYDPIKSTIAACKYLKKAYDKFGNWTLAAASYNRGMSGLQSALSDQQVKSYYDLYLNDETSRYVFRILACKEIMEHPVRYGFHIESRHLYNEEALKTVTVDHTISDLPRFAKEMKINYKLLKRYNPWLRDDHLTVKRGESYQIALPAENSLSQ